MEGAEALLKKYLSKVNGRGGVWWGGGGAEALLKKYLSRVCNGEITDVTN